VAVPEQADFGCSAQLTSVQLFYDLVRGNWSKNQFSLSKQPFSAGGTQVGPEILAQRHRRAAILASGASVAIVSLSGFAAVKSVRVALWIWYRGDSFRGFQSQRIGPTVQETIVRSLSSVGVRARPCPAGRTDKGVHARMQVLSMRLRDVSPDELLSHLSSQTSRELGICYARRAPAGFHAQWSTSGKEYRYRLRTDPSRACEWASCSWTLAEHPRLLGRAVDLKRLATILRTLEGTHDFAAFHERSSPRGPRTIRGVELVEAAHGVVELRILGDRFARHQVRYMVGSAVAVSAGLFSADQFVDALIAGTPINGIKAPARGLILWEVHYPPALDPFQPIERARPPGLPAEPPFQPVPR